MIIAGLIICYIFLGILTNIAFVKREGGASGFGHILMIIIWPILLIVLLSFYADDIFPLKQIASFFNSFHDE